MPELRELEYVWMGDWTPEFTDAYFAEQRRLAGYGVDVYTSQFMGAYCAA